VTTAVTPPSSTSAFSDNGFLGGLRRRLREFRLIAQDPVLATGLLAVGAFLFFFVLYPIGRVVYQGFFASDGSFSLEYINRYFDPYFRAYYWTTFWSTIQIGVLTAAFGTFVGFIFAFTAVRCHPPFPRLFHIIALLPILSPPFAMALATILLFGRNGLITAQILGLRFPAGSNDIYGMDGLVFVQTITFFSISYLILRAMLERLDPSMEEAAQSMGASKFHIFRTVTLPLLVPGLAASFLLLFVESLADLGNPLLLSGNVQVLSAEIYLAVTGEFNQQKASALSFVLLLPTLSVFILQRYWVSRRSYIAVTGKPSGGQIQVEDPLLRWTVLLICYAIVGMILLLYGSIIVGSLTALWGINYTFVSSHYLVALTRGLPAILDTTFLSAVATPLAGVLGMIVAFLVVRKRFSGKEALDFTSNLGGAVPGTILGIGFILAFIRGPGLLFAPVFLLLAIYLTGINRSFRPTPWVPRLGMLAVGCGLGGYLALYGQQSADAANYLLYWIALAYLALTALAAWPLWRAGQRALALLPLLMGLVLLVWIFSPDWVAPLARYGRSLDNRQLSRIVTSTANYLLVFLHMPLVFIGLSYVFASTFIARALDGWLRYLFVSGLLLLATAVTFSERPLAIVGTSTIIIAAYAVRSLPASVRAGIAALHQIDPAIEEASTGLGGDAQYTFRKVTLPLILPSFIAGLIYSFAVHMTSLSAIIFLISPRWRILAAEILSEVEQGGVSIAAAYSVILILIVLASIGLIYFITGRAFAGRGDVDLSIHGG